MQAFQVSFLDVQVFIKNSLAAKKSAGLLVCWSQATHGMKSVGKNRSLVASCLIVRRCVFSVNSYSQSGCHKQSVVWDYFYIFAVFIGNKNENR